MALSDQISAAPLSFGCPRCGKEVNERFYGPCAPCRGELRSVVRGTSGAVVAAPYEPKMHVTPNAVAMKE